MKKDEIADAILATFVLIGWAMINVGIAVIIIDALTEWSFKVLLIGGLIIINSIIVTVVRGQNETM